MTKHPPKAALDQTEDPRRDPWKQLKEKPGVKILDVARRSPSEQ